jgi:hypothetical protein
MARSPAVNTFIQAIGATKDRSFGRYNVFQWKGLPLIVKGDDADVGFWGIPEELCERFEALNRDYFIVLLSSTGTSGWLFDRKSFHAQVIAGRYKVAQERDYKVSGRIDGGERFHNIEEFQAFVGQQRANSDRNILASDSLGKVRGGSRKGTPHPSQPAKAPTAADLRRLPADQRDAILAAAADLAEADYRGDAALTAFEAFGPEDLYGDSSDAEPR